MSALAVNAYAHQFVSGTGLADNAYMHKKRRTTPLGRLMDAYNDGVGITDNELARRLTALGTPIPQSTITRIANGKTKESGEGRLKPLADFFGVSTAVLRGAEPISKTRATKASGHEDLTPEAVNVARTWMQLSPGRRAKFFEEMAWVKFFEAKFPPYRLGVANVASHDRFERSVEADWDKMMRQGKLPI